MGRYRYYYLLRPPGPGCQPKVSTELHAYDCKIYDEKAGREVWGWVEYDRELSDAEIDAYDLAKGD